MKKTILLIIGVISIISGCGHQQRDPESDHEFVVTSEYRYGEYRYVRYDTVSGQTIGGLYLDTEKTFSTPYEGVGVTTLEVVCEYNYDGHTFVRFKTSKGQTIGGLYHSPYCKGHHIVGIR